jgi:hypothetical protein
MARHSHIRIEHKRKALEGFLANQAALQVPVATDEERPQSPGPFGGSQTNLGLFTSAFAIALAAVSHDRNPVATIDRCRSYEYVVFCR